MQKENFSIKKGYLENFFLFFIRQLPSSEYNVDSLRILLGPFSFVIAISRSYHFYEGVIHCFFFIRYPEGIAHSAPESPGQKKS